MSLVRGFSYIFVFSFFLSSCGPGGLMSGGLGGSATSAGAGTSNDNGGIDNGAETKREILQLKWGKVIENGSRVVKTVFPGDTMTSADNDLYEALPKTWDSGVIAHPTYHYVEGLVPSGGSQDASAHCFSNELFPVPSILGAQLDLRCARASSSVASEIASNPVAVQAFQLKLLKEGYDEFQFNGASILTAILSFDPATGKPVFSEKLRSDFGQSCSLNTIGSKENGYSVGFMTDEAGKEEILVGMQLFERSEVCNSQQGDYRCNAFLYGGEVTYSGLKPALKTDKTLHYSWIPSQKAEKITVGTFGISEGINEAEKIHLTPVFGEDADSDDLKDPNNSTKLHEYFNRVIIGVCMNGVKVTKTDRGNNEVVEGLFSGARFKTARPEIVKTMTTVPQISIGN